jgi:hypothetical protein
MKKEKNILPHEEFHLSNEHRKYFGLNPLEDHWEKVELEKGMFLYFKGDTIKKIIKLYPSGVVNYLEIDNEVHTQNREMILPKTNRGKAKKLTEARLQHLTPTGCVFKAIISGIPENGSGIHAYNRRNTKRLPITGDSNIRSIKELYNWLDEYMRTCPPDYFEKVEKMKNSPHITVKYQAGDIFRFELDRENYGFGIIIGDISKLKKECVFPQGHPIPGPLFVPLMIRLYLIKTTEKNMSIEDISKHELLPTQFVSDDDIIWGNCEIIGSKDLEETDIEFPIHMASGYAVPQIFWGPAHIELNDIDKRSELQSIVGGPHFYFNSVKVVIPTNLLEKALEGKSTFDVSKDLRHENNRSIKEKIFSLFSLPHDIDYDEFNRKNNGMTRKEFAEYINKTRKHFKKRF